MSASAIHTFTLAEKRFCWNGIGIRTTEAGAEGDMAPHRHNFFQIFFVASGHATHEIAGEVTPASAGRIFFVSPFTVHRVSFPADAKCYVLYLDASYLQKSILVPSLAADDPSTYSVAEMLPFLNHTANGYQLRDNAADDVLSRCNRILAACNRRGIFDEAEIRSELTLLMIAVAREQFGEARLTPTDRAVASTHSRHVRAALRFLKVNFHRPVCLEELADEVHLTETYLTHLLKLETGKSFKPLLEQFRLEHAKNLLSYSDLPLKNIAFASGFLDQAHFGKRFKAYTQETPAQFRRRGYIARKAA
ncbi:MULTISPECIES: AraC family transcriptional regulator [Paraburkholderia]|uniref:AraC family transcriptional regulator n=1 Tax=Paraburkholderia TaxID=1822464 RepID=UPI001CD3845F|nr:MULTISPECIES: AraC family transcriptional regulator [Paraburkholderia]